MNTIPQALDLLKALDLDWTRHLDSIWHTPTYHVSALHAQHRQALVANIQQMIDHPAIHSPLGEIITGSPGAGKTHFLGSLRERIENDAFFVLVDMSDVSDFWDTVRLGYLDAIQRQPQWFKALLIQLLHEAGVTDKAKPLVDKMSEMRTENQIAQIVNERILSRLNRRHGRQTLKYKDVIRALFMLNADDFHINSVGYSWLLGIRIDDGDRQKYGFDTNQPDAKSVIEALSWCMSFVSPTLMAFDQLDAIVSQHHVLTAAMDPKTASEEEKTATAIIESVSGGLMAIRDVSRRTLSVVSCLDRTWDILNIHAVGSFAARFNSPERKLDTLKTSNVARTLVMQRIQPWLAQFNITPPHADWPFQPGVFDQAGRLLPREILQACDQARHQCLRKGQFQPLNPFAEQPAAADHAEKQQTAFQALDQRFAQLQTHAHVSLLQKQDHEDHVASRVLIAVCRCLTQELDLPSQLSFIIDTDFAHASPWPPLHVRQRLVYHHEGDREQHFSFRVLQHTHPRAFQARLKAAITAAGIDHRLDFRQLTIIRSQPLPNGTVTQQLWQEFLDRGGRHLALNDDDWRVLMAIEIMEKEADVHFSAWLKQRRPLCQSPLFSGQILCQLSENATTNADATTKPQPSNSTDNPLSHSSLKQHIAIGKRLFGDQLGDDVHIPLDNLIRHTAILASSGAGKTVLIRRVVEQAALMGIPSIVIDSANDLAQLGDAWPKAHPAWFEGDAVQASAYFNTTETVIWTPGKEKGRPLQLSPLPDFQTIRDDDDELETAIHLAITSLKNIVAKGSATASDIKMGVLSHAIRYMIEHQGNSLNELINLLSELPHEASGGIQKASKLALDMADLLRAKMSTDPLLRSQGDLLDPATLLLGLNRGLSRKVDRHKTRISVINLHGLPAADMQQRFVGQLATTLFSWLKKHPATTEKPVTGLLVMDEAKSLVPSRQNSPSKAPLMALAEQARKYGLGLIFATQAPKDIDHTVINNCANHLYGKVSSPQARDVVQTQLRQFNTQGTDITRLNKGTFYFVTPGLAQAIKLKTPMCLSHHGDVPLSESAVIERANRPLSRIFHKRMR